MSSFADWFDPNSAGGILAVVFGFGAGIQALEFLTTLAATAPVVAGAVVIGLGILAFSVWGAHSGILNPEESDGGETTHERDPLVLLKQRYARGELSEAEFEHRVSTLLNTEDISESRSEAKLETA